MSDGKISDEEFEELRKENQRKIQQSGIQKIKVTVDNKALDFAQERAQKAEQEAEELREKLDLVTEAQIEKKLNELGITDEEKRFEFKANPDMLIGYEQALKDAKPKFRDEGAVGSLPLSPEQIYGGIPPQGYTSEKELIEDLRKRSHLGGAEGQQAEQILGKLLEKTLKGVRDGKRGFGEIKTSEDETEIQRINRINREKHIRNLRKRMEEGEN